MKYIQKNKNYLPKNSLNEIQGLYVMKYSNQKENARVTEKIS